jgi:hypothetical protein
MNAISAVSHEPDSSMTETIEVFSVEQYEGVCAEIARAGRTYFRGQVTDFPKVLPSVFRPGVVSDTAFEKLISGLYISCYGIGDWHEMHQKQIDDFIARFPDPVNMIPNLLPGRADYELPFPTEQPFGLSWFNYDPEQFVEEVRESFVRDWSRHSDALLQHYGVPSRALDITDDPLVALWFATNVFHRNPDQTASFLPMDDGKRVVYVFREPVTEVLNLQAVASAADYGFEGREAIPYFGLRGIAQKGLLLFGATQQNPDLRSHVSAVIRLTPGAWSQETLGSRGYTYRRMIPPSTVDRFYAALLKERTATKSEFETVVRHIIEYA